MTSATSQQPPPPASTGEDIPLRRLHDILTTKWSSLVLHALSAGSQRTGILQRAVSGISKKMLTQTLRDLESDGLVERKVHQIVPPMVEYSLTDLGHAFVEPLLMLHDWAQKNQKLLIELEAKRNLPKQAEEANHHSPADDDTPEI
ncbi:helix-turn-helix transcriptional regulator [Burkholderia sp. Ax-1719]|nr:helix-turn-helix transcriptional regulator [Burkholderia sp. Ax-1719]